MIMEHSVKNITCISGNIPNEKKKGKKKENIPKFLPLLLKTAYWGQTSARIIPCGQNWEKPYSYWGQKSRQ